MHSNQVLGCAVRICTQPSDGHSSIVFIQDTRAHAHDLSLQQKEARVRIRAVPGQNTVKVRKTNTGLVRLKSID